MVIPHWSPLGIIIPNWVGNYPHFMIIPNWLINGKIRSFNSPIQFNPNKIINPQFWSTNSPWWSDQPPHMPGPRGPRDAPTWAMVWWGDAGEVGACRWMHNETWFGGWLVDIFRAETTKPDIFGWFGGWFFSLGMKPTRNGRSCIFLVLVIAGRWLWFFFHFPWYLG